MVTKPVLLYLTHRVPCPPDKGDRIRAYHLLRFLAPRAAVHLACLADEPVADATLKTLHGLCERVAVVPLGRWGRWPRALASLVRGGSVTEGAFSAPGLRAVLREWAVQTRFDVGLAFSSSMAPYLRLPELRSVPAVVDLIDVDSEKWLQYAADHRGPQAWLYRTEGRRVRQLERDILGWARGVTLVSPAEAELCRRHCGPGPVQAIPNGVDLAYFQPAPPAREPRCVFVGALDYYPNVAGAEWFCREVWPAVHQARPDARLDLVGRNPAPAVRRLAELPGVEVVGTVPDVRPYVARAAVAVAPLIIARGVQNKVLEALAMARAVVAAPAALAALQVRPGEHLLAATTAAEWEQAVVKLLDDAGLRERLGAAGRRYVEEHHDWERCLLPFAGLLGLEQTEIHRFAPSDAKQ